MDCFSSFLVLTIAEITGVMVIYCTTVCAERIHFCQDDILPKLMAGVGSHDDLFKKEISKYDSICAEIADNIVAQEQLLLQIQVSRHTR